MKQIFSFLAVVFLAVVFVACGGEQKVDKQAQIKQKAIEYAIEFDKAIGTDDYEAQFKISDQIDNYKNTLTEAEQTTFDSAYNGKIEELIEARGL